jgi:hypothetical protein
MFTLTAGQFIVVPTTQSGVLTRRHQMMDIKTYRGVEIQFVGGMFWMTYEYRGEIKVESSKSLAAIKKFIDTLIQFNNGIVADRVIKVGA